MVAFSLDTPRYLDKMIPPETLFQYLNEYYSPGGWVGGGLANLRKYVDSVNILISTKPHKHRAVAKAMDYWEDGHLLARVGIGHIDEPNDQKGTSTLIRGKAEMSIEQVTAENPVIPAILGWFKEIEMQFVIQDVRPKSGPLFDSGEPLTNPPTESVQTYPELVDYIHLGFVHTTGATTIRLENAFDRPVLDSRGAHYPFKPVVAGMYVTYESNPLLTRNDVTTYLTLCSKMKHNRELSKNFKAAGGVLNEVLLLSAFIRGIGIHASINREIVERVTMVPVRTLLESIYTPEMIAILIDSAQVGPSGDMEKLRNFATLALATYDYARGGSFDAIRALFSQNRSCRDVDPREFIDMKATQPVSVVK